MGTGPTKQERGGERAGFECPDHGWEMPGFVAGEQLPNHQPTAIRPAGISAYFVSV